MSNLAEREIVIDSMPPNQTPPGLPKAPTGIEGFDEITKGGLPRGQLTLIEGAAGTGKTIMALQSLAYAARFHNEPDIFVAFEEKPERIMAFGLGADRAGDLDHERSRLSVLRGVDTK